MKTKKQKRENQTVERLITDLSAGILQEEELISARKISEVEKKCKVPKRIHIIAESLENKRNLEEVNMELELNDCERLYARNFYEAALIYAFSHGMNCTELKKMLKIIEKDMEQELEKLQDFGKMKGRITIKNLEEYVFDNSGQGLETKHITRWVENQVIEQNSQEDFFSFVKENLDKFSSVREKARYYFCKYLYFFIKERCEAYLESCKKTVMLKEKYGNVLDKDEKGYMEKLALENLSFLRSISRLKKEAQKANLGWSEEKRREYLSQAVISSGGIFDEFNYFYFGYVSTDWQELFFELYGYMDEWPLKMQIRMAHSLGLCSRQPDKKEWEKAEQKLWEICQKDKVKEQELDSLYSRQEENKAKRKKSYQKGRSGENYFRDFILGKRDINRNTLICFLLFVRVQTHLGPKDKITLARLNRIMVESGFPQLRPDDEFDCFVMQFMRAREPMEILMEYVNSSVTEGENFYLYKIYKEAYSHQTEMKKWLQS